MRHLVVSLSGEPHGFVDDALAAQGLKRRVAVTVPNFMFALNVVAETDLMAALPGTFVAARGPRLGVGMTAAPLPLPRYRLRAIIPKVALMDAGVAWLYETMGSLAPLVSAGDMTSVKRRRPARDGGFRPSRSRAEPQAPAPR